MAGDGFFEIIPRAGEYLLLDKAEGSRVSHTIFQVPGKEGKGILVTPTVDGNLLTGPTAVPVAAPDCTETTAAGLETVARLAAKSVPGVNFSQVITSFAGVRSSEKHGDFIIRASETVPTRKRTPISRRIRPMARSSAAARPSARARFWMPFAARRARSISTVSSAARAAAWDAVRAASARRTS